MQTKGLVWKGGNNASAYQEQVVVEQGRGSYWVCMEVCENGFLIWWCGFEGRVEWKEVVAVADDDGVESDDDGGGDIGDAHESSLHFWSSFFWWWIFG